MQLNEILEENSVKSIAKKTNISEENLEALFAGEFDILKKVKTMGFISIIEREYHADLSTFRKQAQDYYQAHSDESGMVLEATPVVEKKGGQSKLFLITVLLLLGMVSWYFVTQFDQKQLRGWLPFNEEKMTSTILDEVEHNPNLSIEHAIAQSEEQRGEKNAEEKHLTTVKSERETE